MRINIAQIGLAALMVGTLGSSVGAGTAAAGTMKHESKDRNWTVTDDSPDEGFAFVLVKAGEESQSGSGESNDFERARSLRRRIDGDFLYVRRGEDRWVIRDRALLAKVEDFMEPQNFLGRQQGLLGRQQGRMGHDQGRLGREQGELGLRQARLAGRQAELTAELTRRSARGLSSGDLQRQIDALSREQTGLGERQSELGEEQSRLGERQSALGARQAELGAQQSRLAREIAKKIEALVDDASTRRLAVPIG